MYQNNSIKFSPIKDRILQYIDYKGLNPNRFYIKTGITRGVLRQKNGISEKNISIILDYCPDINPVWLITGKGFMILSEKKSKGGMIGKSDGIYLSRKNDFIDPKTIMRGNDNTIIADLSATCEYIEWVDNPSKIQQLATMFVPGAPKGFNIAFQMAGDTMYPIIRNLDYVAGTRLYNEEQIKEGYVYIIIDKYNNIICRRIYKTSNEFELISDNKTYPPEIISWKNIKHIYKAFFHFSTDFTNFSQNL